MLSLRNIIKPQFFLICIINLFQISFKRALFSVSLRTYPEILIVKKPVIGRIFLGAEQNVVNF